MRKDHPTDSTNRQMADLVCCDVYRLGRSRRMIMCIMLSFIQENVIIISKIMKILLCKIVIYLIDNKVIIYNPNQIGSNLTNIFFFFYHFTHLFSFIKS